MAPKHVNEKAVAAKERKESAAASKKAEADRIAEEEKWKETDKKVLKKLDRKKDEDDKRAAELAKREEKRALEKAEDASISSNKQSKIAAPKKLTQAQIAFKLMMAKKEEEENKKKELDFAELIHTVSDADLPVNLNQIARDERLKAQEEGYEVIEATGVDAALGALSLEGDDRHPEKRMKAAHTAYEEKMMEELKQEFPTLKRSQLKEKIFKMWQKAPENPMNQQ